MKRQELVQLILTKVDEIEELESRIKDQKGRAVMAKIICCNNQSAKQLQTVLLEMVQNHESGIVCGVADVIDESRIEQS